MLSPDNIDTKQVDAVEARMELDLRIGAILTRFQTLLLQKRYEEMNKKVISYGSCQFPTLGFVVDRYKKVKEFVPEEFYYLSLEHILDTKEKAIFKWNRVKLFDLESTFAIYSNCLQEKEATISNVSSNRKLKYKPIPLSTVEMEKMSIRYLKLNSQTTMKTAEALYNKGFISYPRTETDMFDQSFNLKGLIEKHIHCPKRGQFASKLLNNNGFEWPRNGKNNDKAHPPIHPTALVCDSKLNREETLLYDFIVRRFLACCSKNAIGYQTVVTAKISTEKFTTTGLMICERNFLDIYSFGLGWKDQTIPMYNAGETFVPSRFELVKSKSTKPNLLDEADLVDIMNKSQIGTDATIHDHIKKVIDREYIIKLTNGPQAGRFLPSNLGFSLVEGYDSIGLDLSLSKPYLRREMETLLKKICDGEANKEQVVSHCIQLYKQVYLQTVRQQKKICSAVEKYFGITSSEPSPDINSFDDYATTGDNIDYVPDSSDTNLVTSNASDSVDNLLGKCDLCKIGIIHLIMHDNNSYYLQCSNFLPTGKCKFNVLVNNRSRTIISANASISECENCINKKRKINFVFSPGSVPPVIPLNYQGCLFGCNEMLNEILNVSISSFANAPTKTPVQNQTSSVSKDLFGVTNISTNVNTTKTSINSSYNTRNTINLTEGNSINSHASRKRPYGIVDSPISEGSSHSNGLNSFGQNYSSAQPPFKSSSSYTSLSTFNNSTSYSAPSNNFGSRNNHSSFSGLESGNKGTNVYGNSNPLVKCDCGIECELKTVKKAGVNQGKQFYSCSKGQQSGCSFFEWYKCNNAFISDLRENNANSENDATAKPKCFCNLVAVEHVVKEPSSNQSKLKNIKSKSPKYDKYNVGRKFLGCPKSSKPCVYRKWVSQDLQFSNEIEHTHASAATRRVILLMIALIERGPNEQILIDLDRM
ncbi:DNA topoisomerase 3-alpha [Smittium culicis]|uniref:DNA topoisomerase n=1 Tax=Smittium culicis TaxID=133412 RepID=A0A1R1YN89_9FUNG|nr:DNA topoisomerase 3-alpha [Smittium culicis]